MAKSLSACNGYGGIYECIDSKSSNQMKTYRVYIYRHGEPYNKKDGYMVSLNEEKLQEQFNNYVKRYLPETKEFYKTEVI